MKLKSYLSLWFILELGLINILVLYPAVCLISHIGQRNDLSLASLARDKKRQELPVVKVLIFNSSMNLFPQEIYRTRWDV